MTYRAQPSGPAGTMVYGSFPLRLAGLFGGVMALGLGLLMVLFALDDAQLSCDRDQDVCRYDGGLLSSRATRFPLSAVKGVEVEVRSGSKNNKTGRPYVELHDRRIALKSTSVSEAQDFERAFEQARAGSQRHFTVPLRGQRLLALVALVFAAMGGYLVLISVRGIGRIVLQLQAGGLHATRSIFGVPIRRWTIDVHDVTDVKIEWSRIREFWHRSYAPGTCAGRLVLLTKGGQQRPVCAQAYRGFHLHLRAERQLRALLQLPPLSAGESERRAKLAQEMRPPPVFGRGAGAIIGLVWIGVCCGSLAGIALASILGIALGFFSIRDNIDESVMLIGGGGGALAGIALAIVLWRRANTR